MGESITLSAADGHALDAYVAHPAGEPIAGLVVAQEIFGVNAHIRSVADSYAQDGFLAVAPALFDRVERGVELDYDGPDMERARSFLPRLDIDKAVADVAAALDFVRKNTGRKAGVIGFCFGGTIAWLSATRLQPDAAVGYYAGGIGRYAAENPAAPVMLHFGKQDTHIPAEQVEKVHAAHPEVEIYWYDAGHAFNATPRSSYNPEAARLARERSLAFLTKHLS
ncbi:MAG TPA: dienelactone hydrolase family protein [Terracidiphilus sp.]|jgi:carboxymethylenebutenolidase